jgi:energy-converting hydrogenase A subunit M
MRTGTKTAAIALSCAVALASGAYALGSHAGGGAAAPPPHQKPPPANDINADRSGLAFPAHFRGGPPSGESFADRLGVDEDKLRDALEDIRPSLPDPRDVKGDFAEDLARELGIEAQRVEDALDRLRDKAEQEAEQRRDEFAERLADRLNIDVDKVKDALDDAPFWGFRPEHP